jgi:hypothetical protein
MEQLVLLVVIGLISLINWVMQKAAEKREQAQLERETKRESKRNVYTQPAPSPVNRPARRAAGPVQDPFKDLMDALGLPSDQLPPPPVARREVVVEEEEFASAEDVAPPPVPATVVRRESVRPKPAAPFRPDRKMIELASAFAAVEEKPATTYRGSKVRDLLDNRDSQRKAVILAEILGTPRGLVSAGGHW